MLGSQKQVVDIGLELSLEICDLEAIRETYNDHVGKCFTEMLYLWLRTNPRPTLDKLTTALRQRTVGYHYLADELERACLNQQEIATIELTYENTRHIYCVIVTVIVSVASVLLVTFLPSSVHVSPKDCFVNGLEMSEIGETVNAVLHAYC